MAFRKSILTLDFDEATAGTNAYTFQFPVYNAIAVSTGAYVINFGSDLFTPIRVVKNDGYYRLEFMGTSTPYYCAANAPTVITKTQPS